MRLSTALLFTLLAGPLCAQTGTIRGRATTNGQPIEFVSVGVAGTAFGTSTDARGEYEIKHLPLGNHRIQFSAIGYTPVSRTVRLSGPAPQTIDADLRETAASLDEVVVTGTMKEVSRLESPIPIEIYTPKFFQKNPTPSLFDALQIVNGVRPQLNCNVCNTGDIHINGLEGPYTMILIDGMPIVSALSSVYGLSGIPNSIVERIEVVKGPASTLYGSEAVGGLINVITKNPGKSPRLAVDAFGTSQGEVNTDVSVKANVGKATALFSGNHFHFGNRLDVNGDNFTDVTQQDRVSLFSKWTLQRRENRVASLAARYYYEDRWGGELGWNAGFRGGDSLYGESIYTKRYEVIGAYQLPVAGEKLVFSYSYNHHDQNSVYGRTSFLADQKVIFGQLVWDQQWGSRHDVLLGAALRYTYYDDNTTATRADGANRPQRTYLPGVFAQDEITLHAHHKMLLGGRYDYNSDHGHILTPRLNYKWAPDANNALRLSFGNGYRVVNLFTEDHAALTGARKVVVREALKPERSYNANLNYQRFLRAFGGLVGLDASAFYTYFNNKIVGDFLTDPDAIIYQNLGGHAISRGVTLNTDFTFPFPLKIIAGITLMDVYQVEKGWGENARTPQLLAPRFSGTYAVTYSFDRLGLSLDYTGSVNGPMHLPTQTNDYRPDQSPWFSLMNIQLTKKFNDRWQVYGGAKNLLNYLPRYSLMRASDPFDKTAFNADGSPSAANPNGYTFDTEYNYAPIQGIRGFLGVRYVLSGK